MQNLYAFAGLHAFYLIMPQLVKPAMPAHSDCVNFPLETNCFKSALAPFCKSIAPMSLSHTANPLP